MNCSSIFFGVCAAFLFVSCAGADQQVLRSFDSVSDMMEEFGDYTEDDGTYTLISSSPLHIRLAPTVYVNELDSVVDAQMKRAVIYGIYKTLIYTSADLVRVSSVPQLVIVNPRSSKLLDEPSMDIVISRADALAAVNKYLKVNSLSSLVVSEGEGEFYMDRWSDDFNGFYYEDRSPGLDVFFAELIRLSR